MHGGKTPRGYDLPQTTTGRYSKHLPTRLSALFEEANADPELLSVRRDIALIDALIVTNIDRLDSKESGEAWKLMRKAVDACELAYKNEQYAQLEKALRDMRDVINERVAHYATEAEIRDKIDQRRKLVETEQKISLQGERAISVEQLMLLMGAVLTVINNVVTDAHQRQQIAAGIDHLISKDSVIEPS